MMIQISIHNINEFLIFDKKIICTKHKINQDPHLNILYGLFVNAKLKRMIDLKCFYYYFSWSSSLLFSTQMHFVHVLINNIETTIESFICNQCFFDMYSSLWTIYQHKKHKDGYAFWCNKINCLYFQKYIRIKIDFLTILLWSCI